MNIKNVCIIGAGFSGLVTAKTFLTEGYEVTVFEKQQGLGGVWEKSRTYPELGPQSTGNTYCFSDYPMPASFPDWPTAEHIRNYLESYAQHFGVIDKIRFQTEVVKVRTNKAVKPGWRVTVKAKDTKSLQTKEESYEFDFVVVCNGVFNSPQIPFVLGKEEFVKSGGQVLHSTEVNDTPTLENKRVVVVGSGKSASDIANLAAKIAKTCTLVFRKIGWKIPRFFFGYIHIKYLLLTRFAEAWFPYVQMGKWEKLLHTLGSPLVWFFWRTVEVILRLQFRLDSCGMLPEDPIDKFNCEITQEPPGFFQAIHSGKIKTVKTTISRFIPGGVELANGEQIEADVVVFGTGFKQEIPFLEEKYLKLLFNEESLIRLYRNTIHPEIPSMAFIGCQDSFYNPITSEVQSWWLIDYIQGYFALPSISQMYESIESELDWQKRYVSNSAVIKSCIYSFSLRHIEQLIKDMDVNNKIVIWPRFVQIIKTINMSMFNQIRQEIKLRRTKKIQIPKPEELLVR